MIVKFFFSAYTPTLFRRAFSVIVFMLAAAGCETMPGAVDATALSKINRIGVVSATGDKLFHHQIGFTVFGNKGGSYDIVDWGLDDIWEEKIDAAVDAIGAFETVDFEYDRSAFYESYPPEDTWPKKWRIIDFEKMAPAFQSIAQANSLDAIIVLSSGGYDVGRANLILEGASIFSETGPITGHNAYYWFVARLYLVDGATGLPIASRAVGNKQLFGVSPPLERAPEALRPKWFTDYSDDERAFLRERFIALPEAWWDAAVSDLLTARE